MLGKISSYDCRLGRRADAGKLDALFVGVCACDRVNRHAAAKLFHNIFADFFMVIGDDFHLIKLVAHAVHNIIHDAVADKMVYKGIDCNASLESNCRAEENEGIDTHHNLDHIHIFEDFLLQNGGNCVCAAECEAAAKHKTDAYAIENAEAYCGEKIIALYKYKVAVFEEKQNIRVYKCDKNRLHNSLLAKNEEGEDENTDAHSIIEIGITEPRKLLDDFGNTKQTACRHAVWRENAGDRKGCADTACKKHYDIQEKSFCFRVFKKLCHRLLLDYMNCLRDSNFVPASDIIAQVFPFCNMYFK